MILFSEIFRLIWREANICAAKKVNLLINKNLCAKYLMGGFSKEVTIFWKIFKV